MCKQDHKCCPRWQALFECKSGSILLCQCQTVYLEPEHLEYDIVQLTDQIKALAGNMWRELLHNKRVRG